MEKIRKTTSKLGKQFSKIDSQKLNLQGCKWRYRTKTINFYEHAEIQVNYFFFRKYMQKCSIIENFVTIIIFIHHVNYLYQAFNYTVTSAQ